MQYSKNFDFSFSGLKTAVLYMVRDLESVESEARPQENSPRPRLGESVRAEIAHEAQEAIVDVLIHKTKKAAEQYRPKSILLAGGVSANKLLRERLLTAGRALKTPVFIPPMEYTTDNAAMIAIAGYYQRKFQNPNDKFQKDIMPDANWEII